MRGSKCTSTKGNFIWNKSISGNSQYTQGQIQQTFNLKSLQILGNYTKLQNITDLITIFALISYSHWGKMKINHYSLEY